MMSQLEVIRAMVNQSTGPCRCRNNEDYCLRCLALIDLAELKQAGITPYMVGNTVEGIIEVEGDLDDIVTAVARVGRT